MTYLISFLIGVAMVGSTSHRMQYVLEGKTHIVAALNVIITATYWVQVKYVLEDNMSGYLSFSAGVLAVTCWQAYKNKNSAKVLRETADKLTSNQEEIL